MTQSSRCRFRPQQRLRKRVEFQLVQTQGHPFYNRYFTVITYSNPAVLFPRLGIITSRHYGNASQRSRIRRLVRETFRLHQFQLQFSCDLLVIPKSTAKKLKKNCLYDELLDLWKKANLLKN